ncbi:MAG: ankyrin repeat domain-containing protein [Acidobacteriota bacterium]
MIEERLDEVQEAYDEARDLIESGDAEALGELLGELPMLTLMIEDGGENTLLHRAAAAGCEESVRILLEAGAVVDQQGKEGGTALHWAASLGATDVCRRLLEGGASPHLEDGHGEGGTPLVLALFYGHAATASFLAQAARVPSNLRVAAGLGRLDLIDRLLAADGALQPGAGEARGWYRPHDEFPARPTTDNPDEVLTEALCYACANDRPEAVLALLVRGADPSGKPHYATPLHHAVATGSQILVDLLLDHGADPTVTDDAYGSDAAGWAEWMGHDSLTRQLRRAAAEVDLEAAVDLGDPRLVAGHLSGVDLTGKERGNALLLEAMVRGHRETERLLRAHGAAFNLATAARLGLVEEVRALLEAGSDPDSTAEIEVNVRGEGAVTRPQSALLGAAVHRRWPVCDLLLEKGAALDPFAAAALGRTERVRAALEAGHPIDAPDAFGRTLLHRAIQGHQPGTVRALLDAGADVDLPADGFSHGPRALHVAASAGADEEILGALIDAGALVDQSTNLGTPLECAERAGREASAGFLRRRGAL